MNLNKNVEEITSHDLLDRLTEVTKELCADYPNITIVQPWEQLYALEQSYRGLSAACDDLHTLIEKLRIRCGMTKDEVFNLGYPKNQTMEETVTITKKHYNDLLEDSRQLQCLENAGVDNWDGYSYAMEEFHGDEEE